MTEIASLATAFSVEHREELALRAYGREPARRATGRRGSKARPPAAPAPEPALDRRTVPLRFTADGRQVVAHRDGSLTVGGAEVLGPGKKRTAYTCSSGTPGCSGRSTSAASRPCSRRSTGSPSRTGSARRTC